MHNYGFINTPRIYAITNNLLVISWLQSCIYTSKWNVMYYAITKIKHKL